MTEYKNPETIVLHSGYRAGKNEPVAFPIVQSNAYQFDNTEHAAKLFALEEMGNIYTRIMNPTNDVFEKRITALEGGAAALALSSGQSASTISIMNLCSAGDNVVSSANLYGGTYNLFANTLKQMGIEVRFVNPDEPENFRKAVDDKTRCFFGETLANPRLEVFPIREVADIGEELGIPLIMDNTAAPIICRPFEHGAAIVTHSATKYIDGQGTSIGGVIVDSGNFNWEKHKERFPNLAQPDPSYHGAVWIEAAKPLGPIAYILRARVVLLRDMGNALSPFNANHFIRGLETLPLRIRVHCDNAVKVANYLKEHEKVEKVIHPTQQEGMHRERADKYLKGGYGALLGFELKGGMEAGKKFIDNLKMLYHVANMGDSRSLAVHPASTTHQQLKEKEQLAAGVTPGYVRLSVGIEHIDDIIADLKQALDKV